MFLKKILSQKLFWCIYTQDNMQQISPWIRVCVCVCVCVSHSVVSDSVIPWTVARQALLSMEFSRQEYRNWLPCPPPGATELPYQSSWPRDWTQVSHVEGRFFTIWPTREAMWERLLNSQPSARTAQVSIQCQKHVSGKGFHNFLWSVSTHTYLSYDQFSSVAQLCLTLCDPMDCSTPGFPIHHQLPQFTQTHVH